MVNTKVVASDTLKALANFNEVTGKGWTLGTDWSNVGNAMFETFINKYLFPKITETAVIEIALGNRFEWLAKEVDFVGQFSEEYVIMDTVPVAMDLSKNEELMLKRNYPAMATKLFGPGILKKEKFTLNNNDNRLNWSTLKDAVSYALAVFRKKISMINVSEEKEIKGMLVDYSLNQTNKKITVTSQEEMFNAVSTSILNIQNNSEKYNEANKASGGAVGRYTTVSDLKDVVILTSDENKSYLLNTKLANTFQVAGLDITRHIISFDDLGGNYRFTEDVTITSQDTVNFMRTFGDYQVAVGDIIPKDSVLTYDISSVTEFKDKFEEIKPTSDLYAYVFDINKIKYKRSTKGMLKPPFYNGEFDETNYWIHYYSFKAISAFFNGVLVIGDK